MRIGIDIDDVLVDTAPTLVDFINCREGTDFKIKEAHQFRLWTFFKCSREESIKKIYVFFESDVFINMQPLNGAVEGINFLKESYELFAITSRDEKVKEKSLKWINNFFNSKFNEVIFTNQLSKEGFVRTKAEICKELGIKILIEDRRKYALDCAENGIKVFLMDKPWNQNCKHENITRVKNWNEILERLNEN